MLGNEGEEQLHRLVTHSPPAPEIDTQQFGQQRPVILYRALRGLAAQIAQRLTQQPGDLADHGQAEIIDIAKVTVEGVGVEPRRARQLAQTQACLLYTSRCV